MEEEKLEEVKTEAQTIKEDEELSVQAQKNEEVLEDAFLKHYEEETRIMENKLKLKDKKSYSRYANKTQSDLMVLTWAKDLLKYVLQATNKSPKKFRFTLVTKLQNSAISVLDNLLRANYIVVKDNQSFTRRQAYQAQANTTLRVLEYLAYIACEADCLLAKQYEQIAKLGAKTMIFMKRWAESDELKFAKKFG